MDIQFNAAINIKMVFLLLEERLKKIQQTVKYMKSADSKSFLFILRGKSSMLLKKRSFAISVLIISLLLFVIMNSTPFFK